MATTTPTEFIGLPSLDQEKVEAIHEAYLKALGDEDKASDVDDATYYEGCRTALEWVLKLLHDMDEIEIAVTAPQTPKEA
jgi:hypothetical protein